MFLQGIRVVHPRQKAINLTFLSGIFLLVISYFVLPGIDSESQVREMSFFIIFLSYLGCMISAILLRLIPVDSSVGAGIKNIENYRSVASKLSPDKLALKGLPVELDEDTSFKDFKVMRRKVVMAYASQLLTKRSLYKNS